MKKEIYSIILFLVCISCYKQDPLEQVEHLDGYWEIESVTLPDGTKKEFSISAIVDFIEVSEMKGMRTKVNPKLDGTFTNNGTVEPFTLRIEEDSLRIYYTTPFDSWKETVLIAKDSTLQILNRDNKRYTYKKFTPFTNFEEFK